MTTDLWLTSFNLLGKARRVDFYQNPSGLDILREGGGAIRQGTTKFEKGASLAL